MTWEEVVRECDKRGWAILRKTMYAPDGSVREVRHVILAPGEAGALRAVGEDVDPHAAFLAACKATDTTPF